MSAAHIPDLLTIRHDPHPPDWVNESLRTLTALGYRLTRADMSRDDVQRPVLWFHAYDPPPSLPVVLRPLYDGIPLPDEDAALGAAAQGRGAARLAIAQRDGDGWVEVAGMDTFVDLKRPERALPGALSKVGWLMDRALRAPEAGPPIPTLHTPGPFVRARQRTRIVLSWARAKRRNAGTREQWQLGYRFGGDLLDPTGMEWVVPPPDRFWADPFPLWRNGEAYVFYEEFLYPSGPGTLHVASVSREAGFTPLGPVLDTGHHLSFPHLVELDGELYLIPESVDQGHVAMWRCTDFPHGWERDTILVPEPLVDTVLVQRDGRFWLLGSRQQGGAYSDCDNLVGFVATDLRGPYRALPRPLVLDVAGARSAGAWIVDGERILRTAQDCTGRYGRGIRITEVSGLDEQGLSETPVTFIGPDDDELGRHTLNRAGELIVTDRQVRVRMG